MGLGGRKSCWGGENGCFFFWGGEGVGNAADGAKRGSLEYLSVEGLKMNTSI